MLQQEVLLDLQSHILPNAVFTGVGFVFEFVFSPNQRHPLNERHIQINLTTSFKQLPCLEKSKELDSILFSWSNDVSINLSVSLSLSLSLSLSHPSINPYIHPFTHPTTYEYTHPSIFFSDSSSMNPTTQKSKTPKN